MNKSEMDAFVSFFVEIKCVKLNTKYKILILGLNTVYNYGIIELQKR